MTRLIGFGIEIADMKKISLYKINSIIGYYIYIKLIRHLLDNKICYNSLIGFELNRVIISSSFDLMLCSGDVSLYSVLNLFINHYITIFTIYELSINTNISSIQYLNVVVGSLLSSNISILSISQFLNWNKLKFFIHCTVHYSSWCLLNIISNTRKRSILYILNYYNQISNSFAITGFALNSSKEWYTLTNINNCETSNLNMSCILVLCNNTVIITGLNNKIITINNE